jgi:hypothetical protein
MQFLHDKPTLHKILMHKKNAKNCSIKYFSKTLIANYILLVITASLLHQFRVLFRESIALSLLVIVYLLKQVLYIILLERGDTKVKK